MIAAVWSVTRVDAGRLGRKLGYAIAGFSVATLIASQYRTGYLALVVAAAVWLWVRRRWGWLTVVVGATLAGILFAFQALVAVSPYVLRGTAEQAASLSGRLGWWSAAIPVWESSPIIGRGLLTGTRFEVLEPLGLTTTSSIHSTWVEALVGTGLVGVTLVLACLVFLFMRAIREARSPLGWKTPLMLLVVLTVRSFTGSTFESFAYLAVVFLWLASSVEEWSSPQEARLSVSAGGRTR